MKTLRLITVLFLFCSGTFKSDSTSLTVVNNTSKDLGECTFSGGGSINLYVGPNSTLTEPISFIADSVTIWGQTVVEPSSGPVTVANGALVTIQWPSTNLVEIYDYNEGNAPVR